MSRLITFILLSPLVQKSVYISAKFALIVAFYKKIKIWWITVKAAFNHGKEITTKDEKGNIM